MIGIYFSGTGNTRYCVRQFLEAYENQVEMIPIEQVDEACEALNRSDSILIAYPIYYSNMPKIMSDFIDAQATLWRVKQVFILCTMGLFSGDGAGVAARKLKRYGAEVLGGIHLMMPDCICDVKILKRNKEKNIAIVQRADKKILRAAQRMKEGQPYHNGLYAVEQIAGFLTQRFWFSPKMKKYSSDLKIEREACIGCGKCVVLCPMNNIIIDDHKAKANKRCTLCYRCVQQCPQQAITLIGKRVVVQHAITDFIE